MFAREWFAVVSLVVFVGVGSGLVFAAWINGTH